MDILISHGIYTTFEDICHGIILLILVILYNRWLYAGPNSKKILQTVYRKLFNF